MKKILFASIFALSALSVKAQTQVSHEDIFFTNLYSNLAYNNANEKSNYHISSTNQGFGGKWGLDMTWFGGIKLNATQSFINLKSRYGTIYVSESGKIGINTESPIAELDVAGNARFNSYGEYTFLTLGKQANDQIIVDNSTQKYFGGGYFFRVHNDNATNQYVDAMIIDENGNIGIGVNAPQSKLDVAGKSSFRDNMKVNAKIEAKEIRVTLTPTADFVFEENYELPKLKDVEKFIKENKHLPEVASAKVMEKEGVNVGEFQIKLLQKIEELTLYVIDQQKKIETLENKLSDKK